MATCRGLSRVKRKGKERKGKKGGKVGRSGGGTKAGREGGPVVCAGSLGTLGGPWGTVWGPVGVRHRKQNLTGSSSSAARLKAAGVAG